MKTFVKVLLVVIIAAAVGGFIYWQSNKKNIIKASIQDAVNKESDSLYYLRYDSSYIDEINGVAAFYNISLQSDSAQKELLKRTDDLPNVLFNITAKEVKANGIDVAGLLQSQNVTAKKIFINNPVVRITNTGVDKPNAYNSKDTLELYEKILGRFKHIHADTIQINNGTVIVSNMKGEALTTLENINIRLNNFLVDSTHNYDNIASYFVKDVRLTIENVQLPPNENNTRVNIEKFDYDAVKRTIKVESIRQYKINDFVPVMDLKNILLSGLSTDSFILRQKFKASSISCDGGLITIYKRKDADNIAKDGPARLTSDIIDELQVGALDLGNTKVVIVDLADPKAEPFVLNDVKFKVTKILKVNEGSTVSDLVNNAEWKLSSSGFSFLTKDKLYKLNLSTINVDNTTSLLNVKNISLVPQLSEEAFMKQRTVQGDRYDFSFNNVKMQNIDLKKLINEGKIEVQTVSIQPDFKIYNDRTLAFDTKKKEYPYQHFLKLGTPIFVNQLNINNGIINYKEKGRESEFTGNVIFSNINATIKNLTNIEDRIKTNAKCNVAASTLFSGSKLTTEWQLPLAKGDSIFTVKGKLQGMNALALNKITEPLGMTSIKKGTINDLSFNFSGGEYVSLGEMLFLYNDLKIEMLKKRDGELTGKGVTSFLANALIKNSNPKNGETRSGTIHFNRDITKSFFNFLWKSVLDGITNTTTGK
ncbi:MAG: hypothetical protein V4556_13100 [Bacteroidota bacterium]